MPAVTVYTAARMKVIEDTSVTNGYIDVNGDLILVQNDGTLINAGPVQGPQGPTGATGPMGPAGTDGLDADFGGYVEPLDDRGNVSGTVTLNFATHNVWRINPTGAVTIAFSNLPAAGNIASGTIIVANSTYAITWPAGTKFPEASAPVLDGETVLSVLARSTGVIVGVAWSGIA